MLLFTGMPRSGTGFISKLLTEAGIPCGHESVYGFDKQGTKGEVIKVNFGKQGNWKAESSFMAAPFLEGHDVIHITRNPLRVISSLIENKALKQDDQYTKFVYQNLPTLKNYEGIDKYLHFYIEWNKMIEPHPRHKIEDINKDKEKWLSQFIKPEKIYTNETYNRRTKPNYLNETPESKLKEDFIKTANRYGYII